ncbi:MAG: hypothetical protein HOO98_02540 [Nitrospira sp.]|nr:hypothetical protein [Nitrospira sp.]
MRLIHEAHAGALILFRVAPAFRVHATRLTGDCFRDGAPTKEPTRLGEGKQDEHCRGD